MSMTLSGNGTITGLVSGGLPDATITSAELASNAVDSQTLTLLNASGSAPVYTCRAWVNFNGTGTVAIRASGNVSSITDNGTGDYTVNFNNAMPDANYSAAVTGNVGTPNRDFVIHGPYGAAPTTAAYRFICVDAASAAFYDAVYMNCAIFR